MTSSALRTILALTLIFTIGGCLSLGPYSEDADPNAVSADSASENFTLVAGTEQSSSGCTFSYRLYQPQERLSNASIILGHGFLRSQDRMVELSRALATAGIRTITLNFCSMRPWNGNHPINARDMQYIANTRAAGDRIIFGGFSAGALAALLAADNNTSAVFLLDYVDQGNLGKTALDALDIPVFGLHGPPSGCNANSAAVPAVRDYLQSRSATQAPLAAFTYKLVDGASHCEFEAPSNWLCEAACGDEDPRHKNQLTRETIIQRSVESLLGFLALPG